MRRIRDVYQAFALRETPIFGARFLLVAQLSSILYEPDQDFGGASTLSLDSWPCLEVNIESSRVADFYVPAEHTAGASQLHNFHTLAFDVMEAFGGNPLLLQLQCTTFERVGEGVLITTAPPAFGVPGVRWVLVDVVKLGRGRRRELLHDGADSFRNTAACASL
jgi:hypothetical protein